MSDSEPACKRLKVDFASTAAISSKTITNEEDDTVSIEDSIEEAVSQHANDHIYLHFFSHMQPLVDDDTEKVHTVHPTYTHQLFPNEKMEYLSRREIHTLAVNIDINLYDLSHQIRITGTEDPSHIDLIKKDLSLGIPSDATYLTGGDNLTISPWENEDCSTKSLTPPGQMIHSFSKTTVGQTEQYEIYLSNYQDSPVANQLLIKAEKLAMWFIETADSVDFSDPRWEVVYLYQKLTHPISKKSKHKLLGYMTLYTFHNPFAGDKLRVCQALIFPEKQHGGFGREVLLSIYRLAAERDSIVEVTVEDPSPGFQRLRNAVDFEWYTKHYHQLEGTQPPLTATTTTQLTPAEREKEYIDIAKRLKMIKLQAIFAKEAYEYVELLNSTLHDDDQNNHNQQSTVSNSMEIYLSHLHELVSSNNRFSEFRLQVKRTLVKNDPANELKYLSKSDLQQELSTLFEEKMMKYRAILATAVRLGLIPSPKLATS